MIDTKKRRSEYEPGETLEPGIEAMDACGLCASLFSREGEAPKGRSGWRFMTEREFKVLKAMRALREKAASIKKRMRGIEQDLRDRPAVKGVETAAGPPPDEDALQERIWEKQMAEELLDHCARLANLRDRWREMDQERLAAQEERMRLLGHIQ